MKALILSAICMIAVTVLNYAQVSQDWVQRYNTPLNKRDILNAMVIDNSGNVYVTGYNYTDSYAMDEDYLTIKYNSSGVQQWVKTYNGSMVSTDKATAIGVDAQGNVYVTGNSIGEGNNNNDYVTIKYSSSGAEEWVQRYPNWGDDYPTSLVVDGSGYIYVTGGSNNIANGMLKFTTIKYRPDGSQAWEASEPFKGWKAASIAVDNSGNVYITGPGWLGSTGMEYNYLTIKYSSSGGKIWESSYIGAASADDEPYALAIDNSGNVYVTGRSASENDGDDYVTVKYNSGGGELWNKRFNGSTNSNDWAYAIAVDNSQNVYVTGRSTGKFATIKYNSSGSQQWVSFYGTQYGNANPFSLALDAVGNVYVTGSSYESLEDFATVKYNSSGVQQWLQLYNGPAGSVDVAYIVRVNSLGKVYVAGVSTGSGTRQDFAVVKYSQPIGIQTISTEIPSSFSLKQNYPNPFNPATKIRFDVPPEWNGRDRFLQIIVYDMLGREVAVLVNEQMKPGTYEADWNASSLPSGVYFYTMRTKGYTETKRMVLIK